MTYKKKCLPKKNYKVKFQDNPMFKNEIGKKKKYEPIQASMENSWLESWDQAILIERK